MKMLLNRIYRCIWTDYNGYTRISFSSDVQSHSGAFEVLERLTRKQAAYPERNYRLEVWDEEAVRYKAYPLINSKYALFSED